MSEAIGQGAIEQGAIERAMAARHMRYACPCPFGENDRFELLELIGIGRSEVYRAVDHRLSDESKPAYVAIKIRNDRADLEGRRARRVEHPAVVRVFDAGVWDGCAYIVQELVSGESLDGRHDLSWREAFEIGAQIAAGLAAIHAQGMVHGDVKPGNIILDDDGAARLADFEMAVPIDERPRGGTRAFLAPEMQEEGAVSTPATDTYALGATLAHLTGELPEDPAAIIERAIREDPARRYGSAEALGQDLWRALAGDPLPWRRYPLPRRAAMFLRRHPAPATAAAIVILALGVAVAMVIRDQHREINKLEAAREIASRDVEAKGEAARGMIRALSFQVHRGDSDMMPWLIYLEWLGETPAFGMQGREFAREEKEKFLRARIEAAADGSIDGALARLTLALLLVDMERLDEARQIAAEIDPQRIPPEDPAMSKLRDLLDRAG